MFKRIKIWKTRRALKGILVFDVAIYRLMRRCYWPDQGKFFEVFRTWRGENSSICERVYSRERDKIRAIKRLDSSTLKKLKKLLDE